jgi:hypothetical protein
MVFQKFYQFARELERVQAAPAANENSPAECVPAYFCDVRNDRFHRAPTGATENSPVCSNKASIASRVASAG